jgi:acyl dehydratase
VPDRAFDALSLEDLEAGLSWTSPGRTVTESDVVAFACLSGDFNPIHVDESFAQGTPFRTRVAHGLLGLALSSGLASHAPRVDTIAFLGILEWNFLHPIFFGDTIRVESRIERVEPRARGRRGVVTWVRTLRNQDGKVVQEGRTQTLVRGRGAGASGEGPGGPEPELFVEP